MSKQIIFLFSLLLLLSATNAFVMQSDECTKPTIVQYLKDCVVAKSDFESYVNGKNVSLASVSVNQTLGSYSINNITCAFKYQFASAYPSGPLKLSAVEYFSAHLTWKATHRHELRNDLYNVYADIANMSLTYTKSYNMTTKTIEIDNKEIKIRFTSDMIHEGYDNKTHPSDKDAAVFKSLIKDKLYPEINAEIAKLTAKILNQTSNVQIIFPENTYVYKYNGKQYQIDTSAIQISGDNKTVSYGYRGDVNSSPGQCPSTTPGIYKNYNLYFSKAFVGNFARSASSQFTVKISSSRNAAGFQFRLIDLEFVIGGFGDLAQYFYERIYFTCSAKVAGGTFENQLIKVTASWTCSGFLSVPDKEETQILDATLSTVHTFSAGVKSGSLLVQQDAVDLTGTEYRSVGSLIVQNTRLADLYAKMFITDFLNIETIGTGFKIGPQNTVAVIESKEEVGVGIWVG